MTYYACDGKWGIVDAGTVTVDKTADGYRLAFDFTTADGNRGKLVYASSHVDIQKLQVF